MSIFSDINDFLFGKIIDPTLGKAVDTIGKGLDAQILSIGGHAIDLQDLLDSAIIGGAAYGIYNVGTGAAIATVQNAGPGLLTTVASGTASAGAAGTEALISTGIPELGVPASVVPGAAGGLSAATVGGFGSAAGITSAAAASAYLGVTGAGIGSTGAIIPAAAIAAMTPAVAGVGATGLALGAGGAISATTVGAAPVGVAAGAGSAAGAAGLGGTLAAGIGSAAGALAGGVVKGLTTPPTIAIPWMLVAAGVGLLILVREA